MALGKNLKRDQLIPARKADVKPKTTTKTSKVKTELKEADHTIPDAKKNIKNVLTKNKEIQKDSKQAPNTKISTEKKEHLDKAKVMLPKTKLTKEQLETKRVLKIKYDKEIQALSGQTLQLIKFELGGDQYAVAINKIKEVVPTPILSKIPNAPTHIKGLANIRGAMTVIMDLVEKFELTTSGSHDDDHSKFTMIIESTQFKVGILVNEVPTTIKVLGDIVESANGLVHNTALDKTYLKGLIKLNGNVIIFIDIIDLIESESLNLGENMNLMIEKEINQ